jgi:hypothetical protein
VVLLDKNQLELAIMIKELEIMKKELEILELQLNAVSKPKRVLKPDTLRPCRERFNFCTEE